MKIKIHIAFNSINLLTLLTCLTTAPPAPAASPPVISGVGAQQRAGTKLVDIHYTISDADSTSVNLYVFVSTNSGTTFDLRASSFTGAYGLNVAVNATPTPKAIVWDAGADWDGHYNQHCRVRVIANDSGLVLIPAGSYLRGNPPALGDTDITDAPQFSVYVSAFFMDSSLVTGGKWVQVKEGYAGSHGYTFDRAGSFKAADHPVQTISWYDAVKWCNARSEMESLTPVYYTGSGFT